MILLPLLLYLFCHKTQNKIDAGRPWPAAFGCPNLFPTKLSRPRQAGTLDQDDRQGSVVHLAGGCEGRHLRRFFSSGCLTEIFRMLFFIRELRIENIKMNLKPQDIFVLLKLVALGKKPWTFNELSVELGMSPSEVHAAAKRALAAKLAVKDDTKIRPNIRNLEEFLFHGIQYVFVPDRGDLNRGIPTAYASAPMDSYFVADNEPPPVWPDPEGQVRGMSFSPLYKSAPKAANKDPKLYELLALVDGIRGGRAREREFAMKELKKKLKQYG